MVIQLWAERGSGNVGYLVVSGGCFNQWVDASMGLIEYVGKVFPIVTFFSSGCFEPLFGSSPLHKLLRIWNKEILMGL